MGGEMMGQDKMGGEKGREGREKKTP